MTPDDLNFRHLLYFWAVAKEGSITRAAERLNLSVQTISTQLGVLEQQLGQALFAPQGRSLVLTEAGRAAMQQAEQIFQLGGQLPEVVRDAVSSPGVRLAVGISDGLPKLVVRRLMRSILHEPNLQLLCHEDEFQDLLGNLAVHRLDLVLSDRPVPPNPNLKVYSHLLAASALSWYAAPSLLAAARKDFPRSLASVPVLLPTSHVAVRVHLDLWFEQNSVRPKIAGEFEDSALLKTFGAGGMGVFAAPDMVHEELVAQYHVKRIAPCGGVEEQFFMIVAEKKVLHPLSRKLLTAGP